MASSYAIKWVKTEVRGVLSGSASKKVTVPDTDDNGDIIYEWSVVEDEDGNIVYDDDGEPKVVQGDPIMTEKYEPVKRNVVYLVDTPPFLQSARIRRCAMTMTIMQEQQRLATTALVGNVSNHFDTLQRHARELAEEHRYAIRKNIEHQKARLESGEDLIDLEARRARRDEERRITEEMSKIDYLSTKIIEETHRHADFGEKAESVLMESVELIVEYVKDVRADVGDAGTGNQVLFHDRDGELKAWPDLSAADRREVALRLGEQLINPIMEALAKGVGLDVLEK